MLHRAGYLAPGATGTLAWHLNGQPLGDAAIRADTEGLWLLFTVNGHPADQRITIERTPCRFGGSRPWWVCPGCGHRRAVLYVRGAEVRCRQCAGIAYASQWEDPMDRAWRRRRKLESMLGPSGSKPPGMHWATFLRLTDQIRQCDRSRDSALVALAGRLLGK